MTHQPDLTLGKNAASIVQCDQARTAQLLDFTTLVDAIAHAATELDAGAILSPKRMVVPLGEDGVLLSMPAAARDIAIHKLVSVKPSNVQRELPTIHGVVTLCDAASARSCACSTAPSLPAGVPPRSPCWRSAHCYRAPRRTFC